MRDRRAPTPGCLHRAQVESPAVPPRLPRPVPFVLECSIEIDAPVERVFRFHLDTRNAPLISPPQTRIVSIDGEFPVHEGSIVRMTVKSPPLPRPMEWVMRVDAVVPNRALIDVAIRCPFPTWRHEHRFEPLGRDRMRLTDRVTYTLPGGPLGRIANRVMVHKMLERSFRQRQANTKTLMERRS